MKNNAFPLIDTFVNSVKTYHNPQSGAYTNQYSTGDANKNVYSIGSEIPTKASVNTAGINNEATILRFSTLAHLYIANAAPGKPASWNKILPVVKLRTIYPVALAEPA